MIYISNTLVGLIALLHIYILILEMFFWTKPRGLKAFNQSLENAKISQKLAANQGLYNGFLAAGLIWGLICVDPIVANQIKVFFLVCIAIAGLYGAKSVNIKILYIQFLPAFAALSLIVLSL